MALTCDQKNLLNPTAPEFRPFSLPNNLSSTSIVPPPPPSSSAVATGFPLPPPPPPPPFAYYPHLPMMVYQPAMTVYYHQHYHHILPSSYNYLPKHEQLLLLPPTDDCLGLITSPTSPHSPGNLKPKPTPANPSLPRPTRRTRGPTSHSGRFRKGCSSRGSASSAARSRWVKKTSEEINTTTTTTTTAAEVVDVDPTSEVPSPICYYPYGDCTSLMIRHIPVRLRRSELMGLLDDHCRMENEKLVLSSSSSAEPFSQFDFLYLPIDFKTKGNKGYAFVNFTSWQGASRLYNSWKGATWEKCASKTSKICQIDQAKFQGKELEEHFKRSKFECEVDEYLPVKLSPPRDGSIDKVTNITTLGTRVYAALIMDGLHQLTSTAS